MTAADKITAAGVDGILGTADDVFVSGNAAAFAAQQGALGALGAGYQNYTLPGADGIYGTADDTGTTFAGPDGVFGVNPLPASMTTSPRSATWRPRPRPPTAVRPFPAWRRACSSPT